MFRKKSVDYQLEDDAFDDTFVSTLPLKAIRLMKHSSSDSRNSPLPKKHSFSSLFSLQESDCVDSPRTYGSRFSSSSFTASGRQSSVSSQGGIGPSTPTAIPEFIIPKRTIRPRPHTLTSRGEILSQLEQNKSIGYKSVILQEMRGAALPKNHLERPICRDISTLDFDFLAPDDATPVSDSLSGLEF